MNTYTPHPLRFQRKRERGWKMPEGGVCCARSGPLGNPFKESTLREWNYIGTPGQLRLKCVEAFRVWLGPRWQTYWMGPESEAARAKVLALLPSLRGKPLGCFCRLDQPCHVDVLCELANRETTT